MNIETGGLRGWRKSSFSDTGTACVEVAHPAVGTVLVRDSKLGGASPVLEFATEDWRAFLTGGHSCVDVTRTADGGAHMRDRGLGETGPVLTYTPAEWTAFEQGVLAGEFAITSATEASLV